MIKNKKCIVCEDAIKRTTQNEYQWNRKKYCGMFCENAGNYIISIIRRKNMNLLKIYCNNKQLDYIKIIKNYGVKTSQDTAK